MGSGLLLKGSTTSKTTTPCWATVVFAEEEDNTVDKEEESLLALFDTEARQRDNQHVPNLLLAKSNESNKKHVFCGTDYVTDISNWTDVLANNGDFFINCHSSNQQLPGFNSSPVLATSL